MKALRRDDRFRFSLQWSADTEEKAKVGAFLEHTKEQLLAMVREMVKTSVGEFLSGNAAASTQSSQPPEMPLGPSEQDIDAMVASLKLFDQS